MTVEEIDKRVQAIRNLGAGENEEKHRIEDAIHLDVLRYIAWNPGCNAAALAAAAVKTDEIEFDRWYS